MGTGQRVASLELDRQPSALRHARTWVTAQLERMPTSGSHLVPSVVLMADELVSNVINHTTSLPVVHLEIGDEEIRLWVHDDDPRPPRLCPQGEREIGGNGLRIIDGWAAAWGCEPDEPIGKLVWFTMPRWAPEAEPVAARMAMHVERTGAG